jgi:hypothetical protein
MLHFIDTFLLNEDLTDFELNTSDYNEISLGIIIGSLEKINKISPNFIKSLSENRDLDSSYRAIFLLKILKYLLKTVPITNERDKVSQALKITEMNHSSQILLEILDEVQHYKNELIQNYKALFSLYHKKFIVSDQLITVAIHAYPLKKLLSLESSLFYLDLRELEAISYSPQSDDYFRLTNLLLKGCQIVFEKKINWSDILSIVVFNKLLEFLTFCIEKEINIDFNKVIANLLRYRQNFSPKQVFRFREFYNKIIKQGIGLKNQDFENIFEQGPEISYNPFKLNKLSSNPYQNALRDNQGRLNKSIQNYRQERYESESKSEEVEKEQDPNKQKMVNDNIQLLFENLQECDPKQVSIEILIDCLKDIINVSSKAVNYILNNKLMNTSQNNFKMIELWKIIVEALGKIKEYPQAFYHYLAYRVSLLVDKH